MEIIETWLNAAGEQVILHAGGLKVVRAPGVTGPAPAPARRAAAPREGDVVPPATVAKQFLTPRAPDGTGGELVGVLRGEVQAAHAGREYAAPISPWARNEQELQALRTRVTELTVELRQLEARGAPWVQRQRLEEDLKTAQRAVDTAEFEQRLERQRQQSPTGER